MYIYRVFLRNILNQYTIHNILSRALKIVYSIPYAIYRIYSRVSGICAYISRRIYVSATPTASKSHLSVALVATSQASSTCFQTLLQHMLRLQLLVPLPLLLPRVVTSSCLARFILQHERWRHCAPFSSDLRGVIYQKS